MKSAEERQFDRWASAQRIHDLIAIRDVINDANEQGVYDGQNVQAEVAAAMISLDDAIDTIVFAEALAIASDAVEIPARTLK
jgi:hypothetical protein